MHSRLLHVISKHSIELGHCNRFQCIVLVAQRLGRRTLDQAVSGSGSSNLGQLSLPSLRSGIGKSSTSLAGVCVGWQVTLCDPIWKVIPHIVLSWGYPLKTNHDFKFSTF